MRNAICAAWLFMFAALCSAEIVSVGSGTTAWNRPFYTYRSDSRVQSLYYASEINACGYISGIAFDLKSLPPAAMSNIKIRLKQTSQVCYSENVFDSDGWTVVFDGAWPVGAGWVTVKFECPYDYGGLQNLMVDVSFNRQTSFNSNVYCTATDTGVVRSLYASADDATTLDPQVWNTNYNCGPITFSSTTVPDIKLIIDSKSQMQHIGVMSFNIRGGGDNENDPYNNYVSVPEGAAPRRDRIFAMINAASQSFGTNGPDILGLQEVTDGSTNLRDMINGLDSRYSWSGVSDAGYVLNGSGAYNTIFYKKDRFYCKDDGTFWLSETPDSVSIYAGAKFKRIACWVVLYDKLTNRDYLVLNTHLSHVSDDARAYGAQVIMDKLQVLAGSLPIIVMGDMNSQASDTPYRVFTGQQYQDAIPLRDFFREIYPDEQSAERTTSSYYGAYEGARIDYIFGYGDFLCKGATIERGRIPSPDLFPSDHYPVTAHLYLPVNRRADLNDDGYVDMADVAAFCSDWLLEEQEISSSTVDNGLLARWSFDSPIDGLDSVDGVVNGAASFNGIQDALECSANYSGGSTYSQVLNNWTVCFWLRLDRLPTETPVASYMMNVLGDHNKNAGSVQFCMRHNRRMRVEIYYDASANREVAYNVTPFVTNKWVHVAITYGTSPNQVNYYMDGELDSTISLNERTRCWFGPLQIGKYSTSRHLDGAIDELRLYGRQLNEEEIACLAAGASGPGTIIPPISSTAEQTGDAIVNLSDLAEFAWLWYLE